ncbi:pleckstrin homology domain-containing family J member 1-like [Patiria miniata]|uniref:Pleckstrin homology domain-containing family J member 1 n=1 Tax=Patiria miniata TaxID=46514 RepID=A0A913ZX87_PATMI|nr:pleckstrin homology domain-containing family J member 1-like [Patiria miniata]
MRYSEQELFRMACSATTEATMKGRLFYKGIQQGKLRPVRELQGQAFREREFRLQGNFLFYYKLAEDRRSPEPLGALLLERFTVQREMAAEKGFVFSIAFQEDRERKHFFLAPSAQLCDQWVQAIRSASYEQLKSTWIMLRSKIKRLTDMQQATETQQKQLQQQKLQQQQQQLLQQQQKQQQQLLQQQPQQLLQQQPIAPTMQAAARPPPARPPPPRPPPPQQALPLQPRRNAPPPPPKATTNTSTPQEPAEGLLIDFS